MMLEVHFSVSAQAGAQRWNLLQSALTIVTAIVGALIGDLFAIRAGRPAADSLGGPSGWTRSLGGGLIALCLYAALGISAYVGADDPANYGRVLDNAYFFATVGSLAIAALSSSVRCGRSRARWLGFALFGWLHIELGWPNSTMNPRGLPWRSEFPHVVLLAKQLEGSISPNTDTSNMFRWHVIQSTLTMATAILGAILVNFLPIVPSQGKGKENLRPAPRTRD